MWVIFLCFPFLIRIVHQSSILGWVKDSPGQHFDRTWCIEFVQGYMCCIYSSLWWNEVASEMSERNSVNQFKLLPRHLWGRLRRRARTAELCNYWLREGRQWAVSEATMSNVSLTLFTVMLTGCRTRLWKCLLNQPQLLRNVWFWTIKTITIIIIICQCHFLLTKHGFRANTDLNVSLLISPVQLWNYLWYLNQIYYDHY